MSGAYVKTPGGLRAYVEGFDPKNPGKVLITYESKSLGSDSYQPGALTLVQPSPIAPSSPASEILEAEIIPDLADLESQIEKGKQLIERGEQRVWSAIALIRQQALWKTAHTQYKSFEDYCWQRWEWQKSNAHEVASAGEVVLSLRNSGLAIEAMPASIAQIRPLKKLPEAQRSEALQLAYTTHGKLTVDGIKAAIERLQPKPVPTPSPLEYTPLPEPKPVWFKVGDSWTEGQAIATNQRGFVRLLWGESRESDLPSDRVQWSKPLELLTVEDVLLYELEQETATTTQITPETKANLAAAGLTICKPSITPEEFNRELWGDKPPGLSYSPKVSPPVACQLCQHRTLIDGVEPDRYWCEHGEFDDTLPLKYDWAKDGNEGSCKSFAIGSSPQIPASQPKPESPIVRLKVKRGKGTGVEILGAIVQIGSITHYLQLEDLTLEDF